MKKIDGFVIENEKYNLSGIVWYNEILFLGYDYAFITECFAREGSL